MENGFFIIYRTFIKSTSKLPKLHQRGRNDHDHDNDSYNNIDV